MAAFDYTQPVDASVEQISYNKKTYGLQVYAATGTTTGVALGPIPYCTRYSPSGSVAFLYIQTDRVLVSSASMTTAANYTIIGASAPNVTNVTFTTDKKYIRLTLSGTIPQGLYYLKIANETFSDGAVFNVSSAIPIFVSVTPTESGIAQSVDVGTPVVS